MGKKMIVITVAGLKGGVGKTTTATNIAWILANEWEKRVLVVDADCQGNASSVFGVNDTEGKGMAELMQAGVQGRNVNVLDYIHKTSYGPDIIPADGFLMEVNGRILADTEHDQVHILESCLKQCRDFYDFCVIDCGLQLDMTVVNAVLASDIVVSPMRAGGFEMSAADNIASQLEDMKSLKKDIDVLFLLTMFANNKINRTVEEWFHAQRRFPLFQTHIRNSAVVTKYSLFDGPAVCHAKNSNPAKDYRRVTAELLNRLGVE